MGTGSSSRWEVYVSLSPYTWLPILTSHWAWQKQQQEFTEESLALSVNSIFFLLLFAS